MPDWLGGSFLRPYGVPLHERWKFAFGVFLRWYKRLEAIAQKAAEEDIDADDWDFIYAYFMWCWHLRDWLVASRPDLTSKVSEFVRKTVELHIAHDICNGLKHAQLSRPKRDAEFNIYRIYDYEAEELGGYPVKYRVASGDGADVRKFDLFELAQNCLLSWRRFLESEELIMPPQM